jgi:NAD(P)H-nitrite reductase large subunit
MSTHFVIIGNGAAGYRAAKSLRRADGNAQISVFTEERHPFYLRRQLGDFLSGTLTLPELIFQSRNAYRRERIDLFLMTRIERVDPAAHEIVFASGQQVRYDRLLIATGTRAMPLGIPGTDLEGVAAFDTLSEVQETRRFLETALQAAILGEGIIGLTLAESLIARGLRVVQMIRGPRFWPEMLDERTAALVERLLEDSGVALRRQAEPRSIIGAAGRAIGVETADGDTTAADLVAIGCRRRPAVEAVAGSGIEISRGILVDLALRTNQPDIFAAGDVAEPMGRDEFGEAGAAFCWQRAWAQGGLAAAGMLDQKATPAMEAVRVRATVFGRDLAVIGQGHLEARDHITTVELDEPPETHRRLVFEDDLLVGAIVFGTGESVHEINRLVAERAPRSQVERTLGLGFHPAASQVLAETFARHCPICASELVVHHGTAAGSIVRCHTCNTNLVVRWEQGRGWLDISPA